MLSYVLKRLIMLIPLLLITSLTLFLLLRLGDNDPALSYLRLSGIPPGTEALLNARAFLGLDEPLVMQYLSWLWKAINFDFGNSYSNGQPVIRQMAVYLQNTLYLSAMALGLTIGISLPFGVIASLYRNRWPDHLIRVFTYLGVSIPNYWLGFFLIFLFSVTLGWLPSMGMGGMQHVILPASAIAVMPICMNIRLLRGSMLEQMNSRHVHYARIRGIRERWIVWKHILRNSLIPVLTAFGMHIGEVLGGTVVVEAVFSWPGIGRYAVAAILNRDYPALQCFVLLVTSIYVLCNLAIDIACAVIDPRIRLEAGEYGDA